MDIYFVRHGQTTGNVAKRHQSDKTPLSDLGQQQVKETAAVIKEKNPTHLIASPLIRAIESARPISELTGLEMTLEANFAEIYRPKYLEGRHHLSIQSIVYYISWFFGVENRQLAGESYAHVRQRVALTQNYLKRFPADARIVVVSHSVFINMFLAHMCRPRSLSIFKLFAFVSKLYRIPNASIKHLRYTPDAPAGVCKWEVVEADSTENEIIG